MKKLLVLFLALLIQFISIKAFEYEVSYTTGAFTGSPFWHSENFTGEDSIITGDKYLRFYNKLRIKSELFDDFSIKVNASRSDNLSGDNSASDTKLYEVYAQYNLLGGSIKAGRFTEFNKWTIGSVDGAGLSFKLFDKFSVNAYGGIDVKYGKIYDSENKDILAYGDLSYNDKLYGGKVKFLHTEDYDVTGAEFYSRFFGIQLSANAGYDLTNSRLHDGGLGVTGNISKDLRAFANLHLIRPISYWNGYNMPELYQNIQGGLSYKLPWNLSASAVQAVIMADSINNYVTYVSLNHRYFTFGVNYITGDSYYNRLGISLGGRYSPIDDLMLNLGVASVDYMLNDNVYTENMQSIATYLKASYKFLDHFVLSAYANYYHTDSEYVENFRGGATLQFNIGSGK